MVSSSVIESLNGIDQDLTLLINSWSTPLTDSFWVMMSDMAFWIPAYIICAYFIFERLGWKKAIVVLASAAIAFALCDQISNIVKHLVERLRPSYSFRMLNDGLNVLEKRGGFFGFFSAHAANAFAFAVCLIKGFQNDHSRSFKAFTVGALTWASLVAISRVFVGKHYLGDVFVGTVIGITVGWLVGTGARYLIDRFESRAQEGSSPSGSPSNP